MCVIEDILETQIGLKKLHFQLENGTELRYTGKFLRNNDIKTTLIYTAISTKSSQ